MTKWKNLLAKAKKPVLLHDCHNGCGSGFGGPTLVARACDEEDPKQRWFIRADGSYTAVISASSGLCVGCRWGPDPPDGRGEDACGNTASFDPGRVRTNASSPRYGMGLSPCMTNKVDNGAPLKRIRNSSRGHQVFNYSASTGHITQSDQHGYNPTHGCLEYVDVRPGPGAQVVVPVHSSTCNTSWDVTNTSKRQSPEDPVQLRIRSGSPNGGDGLCLSYTPPIPAPLDPWCIANNNMWRSSTDTLQVWSRIMVEVESMATQGWISRPGAWSFPDALELGTPGEFTLTWEEAKSNLALFAVSSAPLFLGNDAREGRMQSRLVGLLTNPDMLSVNQQYAQGVGFAGGRIKAMFPATEIWAKPLMTPNHSAAIVLFNRGGRVFGVSPPGSNPLPPFCRDPESPIGPCTGCFIDQDKPHLSPCDDNVTASTGATDVEFLFSDVPSEWLGLSHTQDEGTLDISCDIFDIYGCRVTCTPGGEANKGVSLGRFKTSWSAIIPPHGSRFLRLTNCSFD